jgi:peptidoglycan hydrolase-like protein with peptidoglycan-binding domain
METIGYLHLASAYEASGSLGVAPVRVNCNFLNWTKLSTTAAMRLLSVSLTVGILSIAGQALAVQKFGSNGAEVANIQRCLSKLGYFRGPVTGKFASLTQQAVISFQQANRLPAIGIVGPQTQQKLQQACQSRTPSGNSSRNLQLGSRGPAVSQLQQRLQRLGYFNGPITGYYGPKTQQAVQRYQQGSRQRNTAIAPATTRQANFFNPGQGGAYPDLAEGNTGEAVIRLQQRLKQLGYFQPNPTGNYGPITRDAVIAFQRNSGIPASGVTNQQTWNALLGYSQGQVTARPSLATEQIRELQNGLRTLGYLTVNSTGYFGPLTRDALIRFQRDYRLSPDGIADAQALAAVREVAQNQPVNQPMTTTQPRNYLSVGDSGDNVKAVQERLLQIGFYNTNPDGYFSENTRSYVYAFQQYARLNPTGVVDWQTWQALGLNTSPVVNRSSATNTNRYVVVVPIHNSDTLNKVRQYLPNSVVEKSGRGDYVNAGAFSDRAQAENLSKQLRSYGFDARVDYF